ncbi:peptidase C65 Otubain-domain-containing protein [Biscogniauxia sp. FL1348]|nr:peptidase C65 Otubain-domain-containing protein [Biscogniauxia sp. FL1348]
MEPQSDLAQQEAAARDYKPQLQGPLVGDKTSSHAITAEYAKADPTFVAKTMALPQTYSHYRPIQGDGNCGWRAIGFAYFETLIRCGDITQVQSELARLTNFNDYIEKIGGHERWLVEDLVCETFELFEQVITAMSSGHDPMDMVMAKFNDPDASQSLVYHLRLLASSWLKGNFAQFAPWIDGDVESYIQDTIMPSGREIDHMCLVLLSEALLKPNIVLEIAYLDRSQGSEVNVHRIPDEANGQDPSTLGPIIYLLYRPGHYDILYREPQIPMPPIPTGPISLQVNRATSFTHHHDIQSTMPSLGTFSNLDLGTLALIPTFDSAALSPLSSPPAGSSPMTDPYAPSSPSPWMPQHFPESMPPPPPPPPAQQQSPPQQQPATPLTTHPLRFSKYNFPNLPEMVENNSAYEPAFTTNTFKNSHFNVAHYNNMNFQPEMYRPDADDEIPSGRGGGRKRSSEHCAVAKKENRG